MKIIFFLLSCAIGKVFCSAAESLRILRLVKADFISSFDNFVVNENLPKKFKTKIVTYVDEIVSSIEKYVPRSNLGAAQSDLEKISEKLKVLNQSQDLNSITAVALNEYIEQLLGQLRYSIEAAIPNSKDSFVEALKAGHSDVSFVVDYIALIESIKLTKATLKDAHSSIIRKTYSEAFSQFARDFSTNCSNLFILDGVSPEAKLCLYDSAEQSFHQSLSNMIVSVTNAAEADKTIAGLPNFTF